MLSLANYLNAGELLNGLASEELANYGKCKFKVFNTIYQLFTEAELIKYIKVMCQDNIMLHSRILQGARNNPTSIKLEPPLAALIC